MQWKWDGLNLINNKNKKIKYKKYGIFGKINNNHKLKKINRRIFQKHIDHCQIIHNHIIHLKNSYLMSNKKNNGTNNKSNKKI